uniref:Uncharacterized protein n=1 Tax=Plectus sambesii TaxID=2011161 RepID=A0A914X7L5_9BILA
MSNRAKRRATPTTEVDDLSATAEGTPSLKTTAWRSATDRPISPPDDKATASSAHSKSEMIVDAVKRARAEGPAPLRRRRKQQQSHSSAGVGRRRICRKCPTSYYSRSSRSRLRHDFDRHLLPSAAARAL